MAYGNIEIEIRHPLMNAAEVEAFLNRYAAQKAKGIFQKDTYYNPPHKDFLDSPHPTEWLRVRESDKGSSITYKNYPSEDAQFCKEYETKVDDADSAKEILASLGFRELVVVDKKRSVWAFDGAEVFIDHVNGLGDYIELEAMENFPDYETGVQYLYELLKKLGADVGKADTYGYPYRLMQKAGMLPSGVTG